METGDDQESQEEARVAESIGSAIQSVMRTRHLSAANIATRMQSGRNRATLYRILSGSTRDPKVSTFLDICQALEVSPIDVLQLAGLITYQRRETDLLDIRLRQLFRQIHGLPLPLRQLIIAQLGPMVDAVGEFGGVAQDQPAPLSADGESAGEADFHGSPAAGEAG